MSVTCAAPFWAMSCAACMTLPVMMWSAPIIPAISGLHVIKWLWNYMKYHRGEQPPDHGHHPLDGRSVQRGHQTPGRKPGTGKRSPRAVCPLGSARPGSGRLMARNPPVVAGWLQRDVRYRWIFISTAITSTVWPKQPGKVLVNELIERGIATDERPDGPVFVKIDEVLGNKEEKYRVLVILRSDSTACMPPKIWPWPGSSSQIIQTWSSVSMWWMCANRCISSRSSKRWNWPAIPGPARCQHVPYELVSLPGNVVMASREGTVVLLEDLIREATSRALEVVESKNPDLPTETKAGNCPRRCHWRHQIPDADPR